MSPKRDVKNLAEPEFGRTIKIHIWEHGDIFGKCHEVFINPNQLRTWNSILIYLTNIINPIFGAIRNLVSIKTKQYINCFKDLENHGRYVVLGVVKNIKFKGNIYKTESEMEMELEVKKPIKRFYSGEIGEEEFKFLSTTQKRKLTIIYILVNALSCQTPSKVVLTENDLLVWDTTLAYLSKILDVPGGIQYLCTIYGDIILASNELQHGYIYVALPYNEKFIAMDYLSFFTQLEHPYKKGLLLNIRPAHRKYGKKVPTVRIAREKKQSWLEEKQSYTVPDAGDGIYAQSEGQVKLEIIENLGQTSDKRIEKEINTTDIGLPKNDLTTVETQTLCSIQEDSVGPQQSQLYTLYNTQTYNSKKEISDSSKCTKIVHTDSIQCMKKCIESQKKLSQSQLDNKTNRSAGEIKSTELESKIITQKDLILEDTQSITKANKSDFLTKDIQYFSISVIISKTSKLENGTRTEQNISNLNLRKECQARTYCSNIAVSGTCSDKLEVIIKIVNDVIIEAYQRLMQTDDFKDNNTAPVDTPTKTLIPVSSCDNVTNAKLEGINVENISDDNGKKGNISIKPCIMEENDTVEKNQVSDTDAIRDVKVGKGLDEKLEKLSNLRDVNDDTQFLKINSSKQSGSKNYKVSESNYMYSGCGYMPSVHIQNKTYFNFCDLKSCTKDSCKDIRIRYCKKSSSRLDDTCYFCEMTPRVKESNDYSCRCRNTFPVAEIKTTDNIQSSKIAKQDISEVTEKETVSEKPVKDAMSLDSISGDVSDSEINEPSKKQVPNESKQDEPKQNNKDEVSITVNISKISGSSNPIREQNEIPEQNLTEKSVEKNEMSISKVNGTVLEKLSYVKEIINDILKETFEMQKNENLKSENIESITEKQDNNSIHSNVRDRNDVNENSSIGVFKNNFSNTDSKNFTPIFNKTDENQKNKKNVPQKKTEKSKPSKCVPVQICQSVKWRKEIFDEECLCESKKKQASECCICPKYPLVNDKNTPFVRTSSLSARKKIQVNKNSATGAVETVEEITKNKKVSVLAASKRCNKVEEMDGVTERKIDVAEGIKRKSVDANNESFTNRNSKAENNANRPVKIERVFDSKYRQRQRTAYIESEVFSSESDISVDSIEESPCCICVCPVKYKLNISGFK